MINEDNVNWYHENLKRADAETILLNECQGEDGVFLIRDSSTAAGDYVLSVTHLGDVDHYQIRRHGEDAFFSIVTEPEVTHVEITHGLETLIDYLQSHPLYADRTRLTRAINGTRPPHNSILHGRTNLLHRATKEGNLTVVSELLKCGYRSLEAKNEDGQTAVHLASRLGKNDILEKLISHGASVNCRDTEGCTPLHYACQMNLPDTVAILVEKGGANVQIRNTQTNWVPLHEAASRGYTEVVKTLISLCAPLRPRTTDKETPACLAERNGYLDCAKILDNFVCPEPKTSKCDWYHGTLDRAEAIALLANAGNKDGSFVVRFSDRSNADILTMIYDEKNYHFQVRREGQYYYIDDGPLLDSLEQVVEHYSLMPDGLPTTLQLPIPPRPKPPLPPPISEMSLTMPRKHHKHNQKDGTSKQPLLHTSTLPLPAKHKTKPVISRFETDANFLNSPPPVPLKQSLEKNVEGNYLLLILISHAQLRTSYPFQEEVAVKTLHDENRSKNKDQFLKEVKVMVGLNHHCIVRLIGLSSGPQLLMVQELAPLGSMLMYILKNQNNISVSDLKLWAWQIACGMQYLAGQKRVHRDLAARNILLASRNQAKVSDFGLSRRCGDRDYYTASQGGRWPIKWYAPESYNLARFTSASDVWSYGVTLWEMFSYGKQPYGEMRGQDAIDLVEKGERLERPQNCPVDVYQTMERCWHYHERDRPTFDQLVETFTDTTYINVHQLVTEKDIS
ncbi:tyrosine-protein kinase Shark [Nilaparvata lugens]|uniref:tyrosine-protein kinase Shark n=2 Tax=Nilaparvata lugens TaxID=108931 RepID=UPI00193E7AEE|nr:tyrosine-protein kinase Shark [Nilaparvata lugens]